MTDYEVVDLGNFPVDEATPVVAGPRGLPGTNGTDGTDGASAYEVAVANGFVGTEAEWLASLAAEGGGAVESVNGQVGVVVLAAADVGADPAGTAAAASTADRARANHTGTQSADTLTDGVTNKAFLATERTKLAGVATGATANDTDVNLKNRTNHTGTQAASTITGLGDAAAKNTGTTAGTVAAGDDSRMTGAAQKSANLSDLANAGTARTNLGLGTAATKDTGTGATNVILGNDSRLSDARTPVAHSHAATDITSGVLPIARLATGTPDGTKFVRDDGTLATPAGGGGASNVLLLAAGASVPGGTASGTLIYEKAAVTTKFPVARYTLDETSGNFLDGTGNGRTALTTAGTVYSRPPISPGSTFAAASNGTNNAIAAWGGTAISGMDTAASLECYVRIPAGTVSYKGGFVCTAKWGLGIGGSGTNVLGSNLLICVFGVGWVNSGFTFLAGNTYHLVATRAAGNAVKVYVDGALLYSNTVSIGAGDGGALQIGSDAGVGPLSTGIDIDDAAFYNVTLTATQAGQPLSPVNSGKAKGWWDGTALQPLA